MLRSGNNYNRLELVKFRDEELMNTLPDEITRIHAPHGVFNNSDEVHSRFISKYVHEFPFPNTKLSYDQNEQIMNDIILVHHPKNPNSAFSISPDDLSHRFHRSPTNRPYDMYHRMWPREKKDPPKPPKYDQFAFR